MDRMTVTRWRKSSYSGNGGASCIEVGQSGPSVAVRDTKQHGQGPVLTFGPQAWKTFLRAMKTR
jgi:Domain of unknown function (DUF397)